MPTSAHTASCSRPAGADAEAALAADPWLTSPRGRALRLLLHLFERQEALPLLAAG